MECRKSIASPSRRLELTNIGLHARPDILALHPCGTGFDDPGKMRSISIVSSHELPLNISGRDEISAAHFRYGMSSVM
jgi:hypothetical protein